MRSDKLIDKLILVREYASAAIKEDLDRSQVNCYTEVLSVIETPKKKRGDPQTPTPRREPFVRSSFDYDDGSALFNDFDEDKSLSAVVCNV